MIEILDPTVEAADAADRRTSPRPDSLKGKRVGLVENTKFNSDQLLQKIGDILKAEYGAAECADVAQAQRQRPRARRDHRGGQDDRATSSSPASATEGPARRAVCSTESCWRRHGIPSASIVTDVFEATGRAMAEQWGLPNYRFLAMPHPIANLTEAELDQRAREIAPEVVKLLLKGQE